MRGQASGSPTGRFGLQACWMSQNRVSWRNVPKRSRAGFWYCRLVMAASTVLLVSEPGRGVSRSGGVVPHQLLRQAMGPRCRALWSGALTRWDITD